MASVSTTTAADPSSRGDSKYAGYLPEGDKGSSIVEDMLKTCRDALLANAGDKDKNLDGLAWSERQAASAGKGVVYSASTKAGVTSWKCEITLPYSPSVLKEAISPVNRVKWDTQVRSIDEKAFIPTGRSGVTCAVTIYSVNGALVISARDFCDLSYHETEEDGSVLLYGRSIETEKYPEQPGFVRAENLAGGGWVIRPVDASAGSSSGSAAKSEGGPSAVSIHSRCAYLIMSDLKGWLPSWAVDQAIVGTYNTFFADLTKFLEETDDGKSIRAKFAASKD